MRSFFLGIKNLIYWLPTIWKLRPWDYSYLTDLMERYMQEMEKYFLKSEVAESNKRTARQIRYALFLLKVSREGEELPRLKAARAKFVATWGEPVFFPFLDRDSDENPEKSAQFYLFLDACNKAERDAKRRLFKHLDTYMESWWD